ncbi:hypothetical protein G1C98_1025 [Bifidobacterium sp. DSM 109960]|uniref:Uncharacterized protein n=1 Tax=Bifidobacterium erythrocebi TaxID=2675325 RepID=A0A7Y0HVX4_9BIFI|nr:hypothetical protein [Bifidobacterium sp. DSM 109960]NMM96289.1 hypothetical protein [Bifidobacterium sp. DSM 109960]
MTKVKLNLEGFRQVRRAAAPAVTAQAESIATRANGMVSTKGASYQALPAVSTPEGCVALATTGHGTAASVKAMVDNARHNTLAKAVG